MICVLAVLSFKIVLNVIHLTLMMKWEFNYEHILLISFLQINWTRATPNTSGSFYLIFKTSFTILSYYCKMWVKPDWHFVAVDLSMEISVIWNVSLSNECIVNKSKKGIHYMAKYFSFVVCRSKTAKLYTWYPFISKCNSIWISINKW